MRDECFIRMTGVNSELLSQVKEIDEELTRKMRAGQGGYHRISALPVLSQPEEINYYAECYARWINSGKQQMTTRVFPGDQRFSAVLSSACNQVLSLYDSVSGQVGKMTPSIEKNYIVMLMYWFDQVAGKALAGLSHWQESVPVKIVAENIVKKQEYLFFCLLSGLGFDVLLIQSRADIDPALDRLQLSKEVYMGGFAAVNLPEYRPEDYTDSVRMQIPPRAVSARQAQTIPHSEGRVEKSYEELALLASSVVQIAMHDNRGNVLGTGSGIMIGRDGYILTNNHVASGGCAYSVRIEDEEQIYQTDEMIKYNPVLDLAIIRIDRRLTPLPVYNGEKKLVRGQKVVAIGSPMGLFNTVSDGIISGFRTINNVDMIQFTAPISHGSSGGALLNMYGEVIGISTAGFDNGQNLNLAMGYECIKDFARGFI